MFVQTQIWETFCPSLSPLLPQTRQGRHLIQWQMSQKRARTLELQNGGMTGILSVLLGKKNYKHMNVIDLSSLHIAKSVLGELQGPFSIQNFVILGQSRPTAGKA